MTNRKGCLMQKCESQSGRFARYGFAIVLAMMFGFVAANVSNGVALSDSLSVQCAEAKVKLTSKKVTITKPAAVAHTGKAVKPKVKVTYKGKKLKKNKDYTLAYSKNVKAGTARVTVKGKGKFKGSVMLKFKIYYDLAKDGKVKLATDVYTHTGEKVKPRPTVTYKGKKLKKNKDYTLSYKKNVNRGKAKVIVTGKGKYRGAKSKSFYISANTGRVIDVSEHQGTINWKKTSKKVDVAILRSYVTLTVSSKHSAAGDGKYRADYYYDEYATKCEQYGVAYGAYAYLDFADTLDEALKDAKIQAKEFWKASTVNGHSPNFLVLDLEDPSLDCLGYDVATVSKQFIKTLTSQAKKAGRSSLKIGLYAGGNVYSSYGFETAAGKKVMESYIDFLWVPAYGTNDGKVQRAYEPTLPYDMWQYTSEKKISGITGTADVSLVRSTGRYKRSLSWYLQR